MQMTTRATGLYTDDVHDENDIKNQYASSGASSKSTYHQQDTEAEINPPMRADIKIYFCKALLIHKIQKQADKYKDAQGHD